jgi:5-methylcytosine-specific restriction endonuclease McrA
MRERVRHDLSVRDRLAEAQNHRCCICGVRLDEAPKGEPLGPWTATFEHIIELQDGGADDESNLAVSHNRCNNRRNARRQAAKAPTDGTSAPTSKGQAPPNSPKEEA